MKHDRAFETKLNVYLSRILNEELGLTSVSETRKGKGRPDILIFIGGVKIVIEGSYSKRDAENDINLKVEKGFADVGIALHYRDPIPDTVEAEVVEKLRKSKADVRIFTPKDLRKTLLPYITGKERVSFAESGWCETDIINLASIIKNDIYEVLVKEEFISQIIHDIGLATDDFVQRLRSADGNQKVADSLYDIFYRLYGLHVGDYKQIAELIYAKAFLALLLSIAFYESVQPNLRLPSLISLKDDFGNRGGLREAFKEILAIDYSPIYRIAVDVVSSIPADLLKLAISLGEKLGSNQTLLRRDFSGQIYHKIVGNWIIRKGFATYFTTIPASYLLGYIAVFSKFNYFYNAVRCLKKVS